METSYKPRGISSDFPGAFRPAGGMSFPAWVVIAEGVLDRLWG